MDSRQRWQALQSRLTTARTSYERGDRAQALAEIDAALAIDPSFLAAIALREQIQAADAAGAALPLQIPQTPEPAILNPEPVPPAPALEAPVSIDNYARFEQRARRRRVDRKIDAARQAIARRNLRAAASALDEVIELDPNLPELSTLTAAFDELRRDRATSHRGPMIAAAATFGIVLLGATWFRDARVLLSHPFATIAGLVDPLQPEPIEVTAVDAPAAADADVALPTATSGRSELVSAPISDRTRAVATATPAVVPPLSAPLTSPLGSVAAPTPLPAPPLAMATPPPSAPTTALTPAAVAAVSASPAPAAGDVPKPALPPPSRVENDETQIARALQQYRSAYEGLDAKRAQAVWPAVNASALARAFESLESQRLTFDDCRTQLNGDNAVATCQGSARYVPKIGSREPRVEPRTWTFVLRRTDGDWKIETARAER